jgi:C_GCAxxG_C_C family probable redox protein
MFASRAAERAVGLYVSGFNCAEATLLALSEEFGKKVGVIPRIATGFGGGVGRTGQFCGALSGAVMAIGLQVGCDRAEEKEKRVAAAEGVRQMVVEFEKEFGASQCRVLTGCDLRTKEGREKYERQELRKTLCPRLIRWTVEYVAEKYR